MPTKYHPKFVPDDEDEKPKAGEYHPKFVPDVEEGSEPLPEQGLFKTLKEKYVDPVINNPRFNEFASRLLTGTSPEYEAMLKEAGIPKVLGTPQSEGNILPSWKSQPETFAGGFIKSLYEDIVQPVGTPSGMMGIADTGGFNPFKIGVKPEVNPQRLLPAGPRFHASPEGLVDINTTPLRKSVEVPYRSPSSYSTADITMVDAFRNAARKESRKKRFEVSEEAIPFNSPTKIIDKVDSVVGRESKDLPVTAADKVINKVEDSKILPKESILDRLKRLKEDETGAIRFNEDEKDIIKNRSSIKAKIAAGLPEEIKSLRGKIDDLDYLTLKWDWIKEEGRNLGYFMDDGNWKPDYLTSKEMATRDRIMGVKTSIADEVNDIPPNLRDDVEMQGGLFAIGGKGGGSRKLPPRPGPVGAVVDKLMANLQASKGLRTKQDKMYAMERARRFASFEGVKEEGMAGAQKSLGKLSGELKKVNREALNLGEDETDLLFTAVKRANITSGEKATGYTALFKILEGGAVPQRNEIRILNDVFGNGFAEQYMELHGGLGAAAVKVSKLANTMKALSSSLDISAPLRQGAGLLLRPEWRSSFKEMFKYLGNEEAYKASMRALEQRPTYMLGRESGLFLAKPDSMLAGEEAFMNNYIKDIPLAKNLVGVSERGYIGFLNKLRADTFDNMIRQSAALGHQAFTVATRDGAQVILPSETTKAIAKYINYATGRGNLGALEKMAPELNVLFWSPRLISSRIGMLTNPKLYTDMPKGMRLESLKSLLGIAALGSATAVMGSFAGGKVGTNLLSSDFGKTRFGNKVLDVYGGFQQPIVAAARFLAGRTANANQKRGVTALNFTVNKLSPIASLAYDLAMAQKFTGKSQGGFMSNDGTNLPQTGSYADQYGNDKYLTEELEKKFIPILMQDLYSLSAGDPEFSESIGLNSILAGMATIGAGVQDYPEYGGPRRLSLGTRKLRP